MQWRDNAILLSTRAHGETRAILDLFTPARGRHSGMLHGGAGRRMAPHLQPGTQLDVTWRGRLQSHLGTCTVEPLRSRTALAFSSRLALAGLNSVTALLQFSLAEGEAHPHLYRQSEDLLDLLGRDDIWPLAYLRWEMTLLAEIGFALDLSCCAVTGSSNNLTYISPASGRAVSAAGAGKWKPRLLPLPACMLSAGSDSGDCGDAEVAKGLTVTGYFLANKMAPALGHNRLPAARDRLADILVRSAAGD